MGVKGGPTRQYFTKSHQNPRPVKPVKPTPEPQPQFVQFVLPDGTHRRFDTKALGKKKAQSKGALRLAELGLAHRWTPETARKAVNKRWRTRNRMNKRIGKRIGLPSRNRKVVDRVALRAQYDVQHHYSQRGIYYGGPIVGWYRLLVGGHIRPISEKWALTYLGHLGSQKGKGYRKVLDLPVGTRSAVTTDTSKGR